MIKKIKELIEQLLNEFENFQIMLTTIESESERIKEKEAELSGRELTITSREIESITQIKTNDVKGKELNQFQLDLKAKQAKLQEEWDRMLVEKEKWIDEKESMIKERLRLENLSKEVKKAKDDLFEKTEIIDKKRESTQELAKMLTMKEKKLERDKAKVSKYLNQL